jgi:hypothetical protein
MCAANASGGYDGRALRLRLRKAGRSYPPAGVAPIISTTSTIACAGMRWLSPSTTTKQRNITYIGCFSAQLTSEDS